MKILGIITARGGSKGLPGKNIKKVAGEPLILYTAATAITSGVFDKIILSTDSQEIIDVVKPMEEGIEIPFVRPEELSGDAVPHLPVLQHAVKFLKDRDGYEPDAVFILQPTSPIRTQKQMEDAVATFERLEYADSLIGVCHVPVKYNPEWVFTEDEDGNLRVSTGRKVKDRIRRRQDFPPAYQPSGTIYLFRTKNLFDADPSIYGDVTIPFVLPDICGVSVDAQEDIDLLERLFSDNNENTPTS